MTAKQHLGKLAGALAAHHVGMAKTAKDGMDSCEPGSDDHEAFRKKLESHTNVADAATQCLAACDKADGGDLEKISGVAPTAPNIRAVPRFGSRELPTQPVDADFAYLTQVEGDQ
jgi:hypothetical protein